MGALGASSSCANAFGCRHSCISPLYAIVSVEGEDEAEVMDHPKVSSSFSTESAQDQSKERTDGTCSYSPFNAMISFKDTPRHASPI